MTLEPACQIWLDDTKYVTVDAVDYEWAMQWKWQATFNSTGRKFYATRNTTIHGRRVKLYMHKEILKRTGKRRRSVHHMIGDHLNGDSSDNRRANLSWATLRQNNNHHRQRCLLQQRGFLDLSDTIGM